MLAVFTGVIIIIFLLSILWREKTYKKLKNYKFVMLIVIVSILQAISVTFSLWEKINICFSLAISVGCAIIYTLSYYLHESIRESVKKEINLPKEDMPFCPQNTLILVKKCAYISKNEQELAFLNNYKMLLESTLLNEYNNYFNEQNEYLLYLLAKYGVR